MTFLLGTWLKALKARMALASGNRWTPKRPRPMRSVPRLEVLEDRTVPSTLTVTTTADGGAGSLRAEIAAAQSGDTISFAPGLAGQTITLTGGELAIDKSLDIEGPGANQLAISGNNSSRVFDITDSNASVTIAGLTISNGLSGNGGGILNVGTLTVNSCTLSGNSAYDNGGAIENGGMLTINNSTLSGNEVGYDEPAANTYGGAIYNYGDLAINSSTLAGNAAWGGYGYSGYPSGPFGSVSGYDAGNGLGGGLYVAAGAVTIDHSTLADNQAEGGWVSVDGAYGGSYYASLGAGGGIYNATGPGALQMHDTILADNTANGTTGADGPSDLYGGFTSLGYNLIGNTTDGSGFASSDLLNVDPQLSWLQNIGGPTETMALLAGSPAIDAGDNTGASAYDQRGPGFARIVNDTIDIGAFEFQNTNTTAAASYIITGFPSPSNSGTAGTFTVTAYNANGNVATDYNGTIHFTSSDPLAVLPADATLSNGSGTFAATLKTAGYQSITATDSQNSALTGSQTGIQVVPLATVAGPSIGALHQTLSYTLGASGDPAGTNYTFGINWGDGSTIQTVTGASGTTVSHSYTASGTQSIAVTATDPGGFTSNPVYQSVNILPVSVLIEADPANTSQQLLVIDGTANSDNIRLSGNSNDVSLSFDGRPLGDIVPTNGNPFALVMVFGEGGNDILNSSQLAVSSVLVGGSGNDTLSGGGAPNLLIGGTGTDTLYAGSIGDILIGGTTSYDSNVTALAFIMAEWDQPSVSYSTRVKQLSGTMGGGLNGSYVLNSTTVFDDKAIDTLSGGAGLDWYFAHLKGKNTDKVNGQTSGEVITSI